MLDWSGIFNLPGNIWTWWGVDSLLGNTPAARRSVGSVRSSVRPGLGR